MHGHGNRPGRGQHHPGGHHRHGSARVHGHHDAAWQGHGGVGHGASDADRTLGLGTLAGADRTSEVHLGTLTAEPGVSGSMTPPAPEDCPKQGGSGQCLGECRSCPNRGL